MRRAKSKVGDKFNKLTIIEFCQKEKYKPLFVRCKCDCGKETITREYGLRTNHTKSCGCALYDTRVSIIGKKFEKLTVIDEGIRINKILYINCKCDCGNEKRIRRNDWEWTKSCGCLTPLYSSKEVCARSVWRDRYNEGDISFEKFLELSQLNCFYCNEPPSNTIELTNEFYTEEERKNSTFIYSGLDRIDSTDIHNLNNVVPCCKYCNYAKNNYGIEIFYNWIKKSYFNLTDKEIL